MVIISLVMPWLMADLGLNDFTYHLAGNSFYSCHVAELHSCHFYLLSLGGAHTWKCQRIKRGFQSFHKLQCISWTSLNQAFDLTGLKQTLIFLVVTFLLSE